MREIIHNDDNLREEEITEYVIRAKALIINNGTIFNVGERTSCFVVSLNKISFGFILNIFPI